MDNLNNNNSNKDHVYSVIDLKDDMGNVILVKNNKYKILSEKVENNGILIKCEDGNNRIIHICCFTNYTE